MQFGAMRFWQRKWKFVIGLMCGVLVTTLLSRGSVWFFSADEPQPIQSQRGLASSRLDPHRIAEGGLPPLAPQPALPEDTPRPARPAQFITTHDVSGESPKVLNALHRRYLNVSKSCADHRTPGKVLGIFKHDPSRVAYCFLPKVGCTFWIRVFSYLHNFTGDVVSSPWDIPRLKVHNNRHAHGVGWAGVKAKVQDYMRFMFVRHPFSRLWSAYVDKLFLPDFWQEIGVRAVRKLRRKSASRQALTCGHDLTFPEFVEFSLTEYEPHWVPIYLRCDPCQFQPTVIGSMKTFSDDSLFVLRRMGLEWVLKDVDRHAQEEKELGTLVKYNFQRIRSKRFYHPCVNDSSLSQLLWKAFQMNGYIPNTTTYPTPSSAVVSMAEFEDQVLSAFRAALPRKKELKQQKRDYLERALASLSPELMAKVKAKYAPDMLYFGFDDTNY